jgi:uncharacterized membrane protein YoaK (UPF0700 family)
MFRHQGPSRSERHNAMLAGYLAGVGGLVNSTGFVLIGSFTSHVTGNVGRFATDIVAKQPTAAAGALGMIISFFLGALLASMVIESRTFARAPTAYGMALSIEGLLLAAFSLLAIHVVSVHAPVRDMQAVLLCMAMGMQNSLVTRLSGAVVRTTHLTGVMTDLGIETARWLAWWRRERSRAEDQAPREQPGIAKIRLHGTIVATFASGSVVGCALATYWPEAAMLLPTAAVAASACYAFNNARHAPVRASQRPQSSPPSA